MPCNKFNPGARHTKVAWWLLAAGARRRRRGYLRPVTGLALDGSGLVIQHVAAVHRFDIAVATGAADVFVHALQRESGATVVKKRRFPLVVVVAGGTRCRFSIEGELRVVRVPVAVLAQFRRLPEINVQQVGFEIWRLVTIGAGDGPMRSDQRKLGCGVIEFR